MDILERLNGYNPPDRTHDSMRPIAADIQDAKHEIERLREDKAVLLETCEMWREKHWKLQEALSAVRECIEDKSYIDAEMIIDTALKGDDNK